MVLLNKTIRRISPATIREQGKHRNIVVILRPPNVLGFRAAGCRREYQLTLEGVYTMAVRARGGTDRRGQRPRRSPYD